MLKIWNLSMSDLTVSDCAWVKTSMHPAGKPSHRMTDMKPIKVDFFLLLKFLSFQQASEVEAMMAPKMGLYLPY